MSISQSSVSPDQAPPLKTLIARAFKRQCPVCGRPGIYQAWISIKSECPSCGFLFMRENGYFLGALAVNIIVSELIVMIILVALLAWTALAWWEIEIIVLPLALGLPFLFIPYARGLWMALDLRVQPRNQR